MKFIRHAFIVILAVLSTGILCLTAFAADEVKNDIQADEIYGLTDDIVTAMNRMIDDANEQSKDTAGKNPIAAVDKDSIDFTRAYKIHSDKSVILSDSKYDANVFAESENYVWAVFVTSDSMTGIIIIKNGQPLTEDPDMKAQLSEEQIAKIKEREGHYYIASYSPAVSETHEDFFIDAIEKDSNAVFIVVPEMQTNAAVITENGETKVSFDMISYEDYFDKKYDNGDYIPLSEVSAVYNGLPKETNGTGDEFYVGGADNAVLTTSDGCGSAFTGAAAVIISFVSIAGTAVIKKR